MATSEVQLEELLGRVVRSAAGRAIGVIRDLRTRPHGEEYLVHEIIIGELGLRADLLRMVQQLPTLRALGLGRRYRTRAIPWDWLDWTDPRNLRFRSPGAGEEAEGDQR